MSVEEQSAAAEETTTETPATTEELMRKLDQLKAAATQQYSLKNYSAAAESFSEAAEIQDEINGEMSLENADLLYQYGRCLYHVAVANSDVLGGKVAGSEEPKRKKRKVSQAGASASAANGAGSSAGVISDALKDGEEKLAEDVVEAVVEENSAPVKKEDAASKPYFQITGDENFTDSEEEEDDGDAAADAEAEEEEDDFATAFEVLDVARILLSRKLEASRAAGGKGTSEKPEQRQLKERLADTHDLQAEISLENERFQDAIMDTRESLALKIELYPQESSLVAEAHFKLSLALEFASVTSTSDGDEGNAEDSSSKPAQVDEKMRAEAANEMEKALASCALRVAKEEGSLAGITDAAKKAEQQRSITDVKEMMAEMELRLVDLRNPAVSLSGVTGPAGAPDAGDPVRGLLGDLLGESKAEQQKRIQEATAKANDLSGLVKHRKKPKVEDAGANGGEGKGKRKAEEVDGEAGGAKKVKFENGV